MKPLGVCSSTNFARTELTSSTSVPTRGGKMAGVELMKARPADRAFGQELSCLGKGPHLLASPGYGIALLSQGQP